MIADGEHGPDTSEAGMAKVCDHTVPSIVDAASAVPSGVVSRPLPTPTVLSAIQTDTIRMRPVVTDQCGAANHRSAVSSA